MRIAIDYRMISGGPNVVNRGTGRYTQQQLREVLKLDAENEYLLVCHANADVSLILPDIRAARNVSIARLGLAGLQRHEYPNQSDKMLRHTAQYQEWLYKQRIDLYHATTPYQLDELVLTSFDVCPIVTTLYDLIPMVYPQHYWPYGTPFHEELGYALRSMTKADRLLAISESAKSDAHLYLGVPQDRIDIAYPIAEPIFRRIPSSAVKAIMEQLRRRLPIPDTFIMSLSHIHHSKNIETLLAAYARLSYPVRQQLPLVIVFFLRDSDRELLQAQIAKHGISENVILTGLISDDELVALYNAATMVLHPSRYEGFGMPVVEAMQCGAPVITTTASSLPEAGGDAAILIDPDDVQGFTDAMEELFGNADRREIMRQRGLDHVKKFNSTQLGQNTLDCYQEALRPQGDRQITTKPSIAMWTSLPPLKCGIADYTTELIEYMSSHYNIEIFVDDGYLPTPDVLDRHTVHHHSLFERRNSRKPFDAIVYQMGISFMHDYMYDYIQRYPGVVVIHDLICAAALYYVYSGRNQLASFKRDIIAVEGRKALQEFENINRLSGELHERELGKFFENYYLLNWIIKNSIAQIVHMEFARHELEARYSKARVYTIDMGVQDPWIDLPPLKTNLLRQNLGLHQDHFIAGIFGSVAPIKRIDVCIKAFYQLLFVHPDSLLLVVGELVDSEYVQQLRALVNSLGIANKVHFAGRVVRQEFDDYLLACDVVLNLRHPPKIQMSAVLNRAIAAGKPVIISDIPEWRDFPSEFCWRIAPGASEVDLLGGYLCTIASDPVLKQQMSNSARNHFKRVGTLAHMATQYMDIIGQITQNSDATAIANYQELNSI
jgi:glycosyltransferase involved in cell wall biosynthesis